MDISIELFCGTKSFSKVAEQRKIITLTVDNDSQHNPNVLKNILEIERLPSVDFLWASPPPCTAFSVASIGKHWDKLTSEPKTQSAKDGLLILDKLIQLISTSRPKKWYIENPRGKMRTKINEIFKKYGVYYIHHQLSYCQYELELPAENRRMKPTDIWTNDSDWKPKPICKNGDKCHVAAPRGSRTGTQGIKGHVARGVIPPGLFIEIFNHHYANNPLPKTSKLAISCKSYINFNFNSTLD